MFSDALVEAVRRGNFKKAQRILERGRNDIDLNQPVWYDGVASTVLHLACAWDNLDMARLLIQHGAHVNVADRYGRKPLHLVDRNADFVQFLIEAGADVEATFGLENETPLHGAKNADVANLLLDSGASLEVTDNQGNTPLCSASRAGFLDVVNALVEKGANVMATNRDGKAPLHYAVRDYDSDDNSDIVKTLIENGKADVGLSETVAKMSPLMEACACRNIEAAILLIQHGANVRATNHKMDTALHFAASHYSVELVEMLIENGADVNAQNNNGMVPLRHAFRYPKVFDTLVCHGAFDEFAQWKSAIYQGDCEKVQYLIDVGTNVNLSSGGAASPETPLSYACGRPSSYAYDLRQIKIVELLLKAGAYVNVSPLPLRCAIQAGYPGVVELLLKAGAEVDMIPSPLRGPLQNRHYEIIRMLVEAGADVKDGTSGPINLSQFYAEGATETVKLLLDHGADINASDSSGRTLLFKASYINNLEFARFLLQRGAAVNGCCDEINVGHTPLMVARSIQMSQLLLDYGADVNLQDRDGVRALHKACRYFGNHELVRWLLARGANILAVDNSGKTCVDVALRANATTLTSMVDLVNACKTGDMERAEKLIRLDSTFGQIKLPNPLVVCASWTDFVSATVKVVQSCRGNEQSMALLESFCHADALAQLQPSQDDGEFILHYVCRHGRLQSAQNLYRKGADLNVARDDGKTALILASESGHIDVVNWLVSQEADITKTDKLLNTALHYACKKGDVDIVRCLVENVPNDIINAKNWIQESPFDLALHSNHDALVDYLSAQMLALVDLG